MKKRHISIFGIAFLLATQLLWSKPSLATDYYVDANVGNDTYSGLTPTNAFAGLKHSMRQLQAGDTLYVRSGEYYETIPLRSTDIYNNGNKYNSGTSTQPITVKAYQNEAPVISTNAFFAIEDISWWTFEGLTFQKSSGIRLGTHDPNLTPATSQCTSIAENITITGNRFQHGSKTGISIACAHHFRIQNNIFDNLRSRTEGIDKFGILLLYFASDGVISGNHFIDIGADGIHLLDWEGAAFTNIVIMGNEFEIQRPYRYRDEDGNVVPENQQPFDNVGENAIDIKQGPGPILISKNIIHGFHRTTTGQDASGAPGEGIITHEQARNITLSKNHLYDNQIHIVVSKGSNSNQQPDVNLLVHNNIFDELNDPNTSIDKTPIGLIARDVRNVQVFNNTFRSQYGDKVKLIELVNISSVELSNNAFHNGKIVTDDASRANLVADYNAWAQVTANTFAGELQPDIIGTNDIITDSLEIDPATWDPLEGSPLIDAGSYISVITSDYNDAPISGLGHDIGAVEFTAQQNTDTEAPTVSITAPADGSTVSDSVQINAAASDNTGIDKVRLFINGTLATTDTTAPYTFTWNSASHTNGSIVEIKTRAFDSAGNIGEDVVSVTANNQVTVQDTTPPVISTPSNRAREATGQLTSVSLGTASATDAVDGPVAVTNSNTGPFSVGRHSVTWTATDAAGNTATATQTITVTDTTAPAVNAPANVSVASTGSFTAVQLGSASAVDLVDGSLSATPDTGGPFSVGTHAVRWRATDAAGNTSTDTQLVTITEQPDTTPPVVTPPPDLTVGATGILTMVDPGLATANDDVSGVLTPISDNTGPFTSGLHQIIWRATDVAGNTAEAVQYITVLPQANFIVDQSVGEGSHVTVTVLLSGEAPAYPVAVPYVVTGTASNPYDHNATDGMVLISSGIAGSLSFQTVDDGINGETPNTLVFEMHPPTNAVSGISATHTATIFEQNMEPLVDFTVSQSGVPTRTVYAYDGPVVVSASVRDPNPDDTHVFDWSETDNRLFSETGLDTPDFSFDPQYLEPGLYKLSVAVIDTGIPAEGTSAEVVVNVMMERPVLSNQEDHDHDGRNDTAEGTADTDQDGIPDYLDSINNPAVLQGINGVSDHHLLAAEAGLHLKLGATALATGKASALVTLEDISNFGIDGGSGLTSKKSSDFPGGLYDFVITGLPVAGQSVRIVLPQVTPLPKAAVYRKYIPGVGWQKFVTDGDNKIASAPGHNGVCAAPGDLSYRNGLHPGDYCIQLTIVDGGANDTDNIPNGVIRDPGGIGIDSQAAGGSGSSGGGCTINPSSKMDPLWLLILLISSAGYVRTRLH